MKQTALALILSLILISCETSTEAESDVNESDTTVVIHEYEDNNTSDKNEGSDNDVAKDDSEDGNNTDAKIDYMPLMNEYHQILCKKKNNTATVDDNIRLAELTKHLNDIRKTLSDDEKFTFTAEMAKAATTEDC